jgi:hypothetical protein
MLGDKFKIQNDLCQDFPSGGKNKLRVKPYRGLLKSTIILPLV